MYWRQSPRRSTGADASACASNGIVLGDQDAEQLESRAAAEGVRVVRLETNKTLTEAIGLYRSAGYREIGAFNDEPYAHHWFEKNLDAISAS